MERQAIGVSVAFDFYQAVGFPIHEIQQITKMAIVAYFFAFAVDEDVRSLASADLYVRVREEPRHGVCFEKTRRSGGTPPG